MVVPLMCSSAMLGMLSRIPPSSCVFRGRGRSFGTFEQQY
jgi:hypothetical protein